jgi:hypothetical protein
LFRLGVVWCVGEPAGEVMLEPVQVGAAAAVADVAVGSDVDFPPGGPDTVVMRPIAGPLRWPTSCTCRPRPCPAGPRRAS